MKHMNDTKRRKSARRQSFGTIIATGTTTNPAFKIRWWEGSRRRKKSGFRTRTEAAEALARVRTGLGDGTLVEKRRASVGYDEVARQWLDLHSKPNLRSHDDNEERHRVHVAPFFGDAPLTVVTATRILEFRAKLQGGGLAPRTVNLVLALVRAVLRFAVANGHIATSPTDRLGRGKLMLPIEKAKLAPPIERPEDVGRLLAALREISEESRRPWLYPFFSLLAYTGLRRGEALGLRWSDVDLERRMITVRRSYGGQTKSSKHRTVPMPSVLVAILRAARASDPWKGELCFPNESGEMYSPNSKVEVFFERALARCGLRRIRVHDLRHVFASHFVMAGGDIFTLQRILGHSTPQLTSDTYAHLSPRHLAGEAERIAYPEPVEAAKVLPFEASATGQSADASKPAVADAAGAGLRSA
jgi:integrase